MILIINYFLIINLQYIKQDMAKRPKTLLTLFSLFLLLNFFTNVLTGDVRYIDGKGQDSGTSSSSFILKFDKETDMPPYVKVTLTPKNNLDTPTFCYSPTDKNCIKDRVVLASRVDKKPVMACVKKEEIPFGEKSLNVLVTCKSGQPCKYDLLFEGQDKCERKTKKWNSMFSEISVNMTLLF